jgi:ribosomal protein L27
LFAKIDGFVSFERKGKASKQVSVYTDREAVMAAK